MSEPPRRFPSPWSIDESEACFVVSDYAGQKLAYFYFEREAGRRAAAKLGAGDKHVIAEHRIEATSKAAAGLIERRDGGDGDDGFEFSAGA